MKTGNRSCALCSRKLFRSELHVMHKWLDTDFMNQWYAKGGYSYQEIVHSWPRRLA